MSPGCRPDSTAVSTPVCNEAQLRADLSVFCCGTPIAWWSFMPTFLVTGNRLFVFAVLWTASLGGCGGKVAGSDEPGGSGGTGAKSSDGGVVPGGTGGVAGTLVV